MKKKLLITSMLMAAAACAPLQAGEEPAKLLLITGGCCHEYATQKEIIKKGLEERLNVAVTQIHSDDTSPRPPLPNHGNPDYAEGYDLVIHDECAAAINDPAVINDVLAPHKKGLPGVNLHCAMHSYRFGNIHEPVQPDAENAAWFNYVGLQTVRHGPHIPLSVRLVDTGHPANAGLVDWTTGKEELYHVIKVMPGSHVLARGLQTERNKAGEETVQDHALTWAHTYGPEGARVWSTTMGHYSETVADDRYLDMVANGVIWALDRETLRR